MTLVFFRIRSEGGSNTQLVQKQHRLTRRASSAFQSQDGIPAQLPFRICSVNSACSHCGGQLFSTSSVQGACRKTRSGGEAHSVVVPSCLLQHKLTPLPLHMIGAATLHCSDSRYFLKTYYVLVYVNFFFL